jgi:hypothetical protein
MRTTIRLDDQLLRRVKHVAAQSGRTLTAVIEDALRQSLSRRPGEPKPKPIRLIRTGVGGLRPGVDLDHTAELLDVMEPPQSMTEPADVDG